MKDFFTDHEGLVILKDWNPDYTGQILMKWNREVPIHVKRFNSFADDRTKVIYLAIFIEQHINKTVELLFPEFSSLLDESKTSISIKVNILDSFLLLPRQIFEAVRCINNIRNEFAHNIELIKFDDLNKLPEKRKKKSIGKLVILTNEYTGTYTFDIEDTLINRFRALCMNVIEAFRIYQPQIEGLRDKLY